MWTAAPDGSDRRLLINREVASLAWSPDGKQLALVGGDVHGIAVVNADGSGLRELASISVTGSRPAWSPDGQAIAFDVHHRDITCESVCAPSVFYVTADGSTTGLLIENASSPSWHK